MSSCEKLLDTRGITLEGRLSSLNQFHVLCEGLVTCCLSLASLRLGQALKSWYAFPGGLRDEPVSRVLRVQGLRFREAAAGISISSCEKLLDTRGITLEGA